MILYNFFLVKFRTNSAPSRMVGGSLSKTKSETVHLTYVTLKTSKYLKTLKIGQNYNKMNSAYYIADFV